MTAPAARTCLWFENQAEEAARHYVSLFDDAQIDHVYPQRGDPEGRAFIVLLSILGQRYTFLNGGPHYKLSPAASIEIHVDTQAEVDRLWSALLADGGSEAMCGWLTDRFGVSWQIIPRNLMRYMTTSDNEVAGRVIGAMMQMKKLDVAALDAAARG